MKLWFNLLCRDIEAQLRFYAGVTGWSEATASRSPIYRALQHDGVQFGFNAPAAYALLALGDRRPAGIGVDGVGVGVDVDAADAAAGSVAGRAGSGEAGPSSPALPPVTAYPTFMLDSTAAVEAACERALALGGRIVKPPAATYYGQWQAVLADPEAQVFRVAAAALPPGVQPAPRPVEPAG